MKGEERWEWAILKDYVATGIYIYIIYIICIICIWYICTIINLSLFDCV